MKTVGLWRSMTVKQLVVELKVRHAPLLQYLVFEEAIIGVQLDMVLPDEVAERTAEHFGYTVIWLEDNDD